MTNYDEMSLEELEALKASRVKAKLAAELMAEDEAQKAQEQEEFKQKIIEEYKNSVHKEDSVAKISLNTDLGTSKAVKVNQYAEWFKKEVPKYHTYESLGRDTWDFTNSDSGCDTTVSSWSPNETYARMIWTGMYEESKLMKVAVKGLDIQKGAGLDVTIRAIGKFGDPSNVAACECISCSSAALTNYNVTLEQYGISTEICEEDVWDVGEEYRSKMLFALGKTWGNYFDSLIYAQLETATPGYTSSIASTAWDCTPSLSGSCCSDSVLVALYNAIDDVITQMRVANYDPDYIIIHPTISRMFRAFSGVAPVFLEPVVMDNNGKLKSILGVSVIEYNSANTCTEGDAGGSEEVVIIIDSSRAVGAVFGKHPTLESDRNIDCNSTTYAMWAFFGTAELDTNAIGHVQVTG